MARDFGKIRATFWTDERLQGLGRGVRETACYLLTSEHTTALGAFRLPLAYIADDLGLTADEVQSDIIALQGCGWLIYDHNTKVVFVKRFLKHNVPENVNVWRHIGSLLKALPNSFSAYDEVRNTVPEEFRKGIETVPKQSRIPEPEPEPEPSLEARAEKSALPKTDVSPISKPKSDRGARWPKDAIVVEAWIDDARKKRSEHGLPPVDLRLEAERFANYWASKSGGNSTKLDWHLTWINWVLKAEVCRKAGQNGQYGNFQDTAREWLSEQEPRALQQLEKG